LTTIDNDQIKSAVQDRYAEVARSADGCGGTSCCSEESALYTVDQIQGLPSGAVTASAGCGNPSALASLQVGETVVDFGSGGGIDCFLAAREVGESGTVIGVDMTPDMVELAKKNAQTLGLSNVTFHLADMEDTPIPDASVDVIMSNCVICLTPDKDAVFREALRILRPGGRLFVSDMLLAAPLPPEEAADTDNWVSCLAGAELTDTYLGRMDKAGFADIEVLSANPLSSEGWRANIRSTDVKATKPA